MNQRSSETRMRQPGCAVEQQEATEMVRNRSSIAEPDYLDLFVLTGDLPIRPPEDWARAMFEEVAGRTGQFIWRVLLGLRLSGHASDVAGWRVGASNDRWIRLEASGRWLTGNLLVVVADREVSMATVVGYHGRWGGWLWRTLSKVHRHEVPGLLRDAASRLCPAALPHQDCENRKP